MIATSFADCVQCRKPVPIFGDGSTPYVSVNGLKMLCCSVLCRTTLEEIKKEIDVKAYFANDNQKV